MHIISYITQMRDNDLSVASASGALAALKHFYEINDFTNINWNKIRKFKRDDGEMKGEDRPYTRQEIKLLVDNTTTLRDRVILLLLASSGMRREGVVKLQIKDLVSIDKYGIYKIEVYARTKSRYFTFCTPECRKAIDDYLEWRSRLGEKITPNSILLRYVFDIRSQVEIRGRVRGIQAATINSVIRDLNHFTGIKEVQHLTEDKKPAKMRTSIMTCHGLRKFFDTTCTTGGMSPLYVEMLMGHKSGLKHVYFKPTWQEVLEGNDKMNGYISIINELTINNENRLKTEVSQLKQDLLGYSDVRRQIDDIKKQIGII